MVDEFGKDNLQFAPAGALDDAQLAVRPVRVDVSTEHLFSAAGPVAATHPEWTVIEVSVIKLAHNNDTAATLDIRTVQAKPVDDILHHRQCRMEARCSEVGTARRACACASVEPRVDTFCAEDVLAWRHGRLTEHTLADGADEVRVRRWIKLINLKT